MLNKIKLLTESDIDLPNAPRDVEDLQNDKLIEKCVTDFHNILKLTRNIDSRVYNGWTNTV